jgi:arylsulfatase A-like enzyme
VINLIEDYSVEDSPFFIYYPIHAPHVPCLPTEEFEGKSALGPYGDMVLMIDDIVGRIMGKLDDCGLTDNTIIVFSSDNGGEHEFPDHRTNHIYRGFKSDIWDGGHRVPFIVKHPGMIPPSMVSDALMCLTDQIATFAQILGVSLLENEGEDSFSSLSIWQGLTSSVRSSIVNHSGLGMFSIRRGKWKLNMCSDGGGFIRPGYAGDESRELKLYDMQNDAAESANLADKHPEIVKSMVDELTKIIKDGRSTPGIPQKNTGPAWWPELSWMS